MSFTRDPHYVLVIDDDADLRESIGIVLQAAGYGFVVAGDGAEALQRLRTNQATPCMVLLDLMMPRMSGFEVRAEMRADPSLAAIPVVVVTGAGPLADRRADELDAEVLRKPVEVHELLAAVARHCPGRTAPAP